MSAQRWRISFLLAASLMLVAGCTQAGSADKPPALQALEGQGLTVMQEFKVGGGLRAFAALAGDRPIAVYITGDGNAIVGTRLNVKGEPMDEADLESWLPSRTATRNGHSSRPLPGCWMARKMRRGLSTPSSMRTAPIAIASGKPRAPGWIPARSSCGTFWWGSSRKTARPRPLPSLVRLTRQRHW